MHKASLSTLALALFTLPMATDANVSFIPVFEMSGEPIPYSLEAESHLIDYFSTNGREGVAFDDDFRAETGFDYVRYRNHQCFNIVTSADQRICARLFGPFADLNETFRSGMLFGMILRHSAAAHMNDVPQALLEEQVGARAAQSLPVGQEQIWVQDPLKEDERMWGYMPLYDPESASFYDPRTDEYVSDDGNGAPVYFHESTGMLYDPVTQRRQDHHRAMLDQRSARVWDACLRNGNGNARACYQANLRLIHHESMPALDSATFSTF